MKDPSGQSVYPDFRQDQVDAHPPKGVKNGGFYVDLSIGRGIFTFRIPNVMRDKVLTTASTFSNDFGFWMGGFAPLCRL
jgi:hypothetical protein